MSIPSVSFGRANRVASPNGRQSPANRRKSAPGKPPINKTKSSKLELKFSSSNSESEDINDLPKLQTKKTAQQSSTLTLIFSASSDEYEESEGSSPVAQQQEEVDWAPKDKPKHRQESINTKKRAKPIKEKKEIIQKVEQDFEDEFVIQNDVQTLEEDFIQPVEIKPYTSTYEAPKIIQPEQVVSIPKSIDINTPADQCQLYTLQIYGESKISRWKRNFRFIKNEEVIFESNPHKYENKKTHVICSKPPIQRYSQTCKGVLKQHESGKRFTLTAKSEKNQGKFSEIMGLAYFDPEEMKDVKAFVMIYPKEGQEPYFPLTKKESLSRLARNSLKGHIGDQFEIFKSKLPTKDSEGVLHLGLGVQYVVPSIKNMLICDANGRKIFMIYKVSDGALNVKFAPPLTELIAFSIAIAVSTSTK